MMDIANDKETVSESICNLQKSTHNKIQVYNTHLPGKDRPRKVHYSFNPYSNHFNFKNRYINYHFCAIVFITVVST